MNRYFLLFFVCFILKIHPLYAQVGCTPEIPKHFDIMVAYDQACIDQHDNVADARQHIMENMDAAVGNLNTLFAQFNVTFGVVFFPDNVYPNNLTRAQIIDQLISDFPCVPVHGIVFFQGDFAGGHTQGTLSVINAGSFSASLITHELGHQIFGAGHTDNGVCSGDCTSNWMESNFMCETGDELEFTSCQIQFLNNVWFANGCPQLMRHIEDLPDDFTCPALPTMSLTVDKKYLIRGCDKNRSDVMVNLTITGGSTTVTGSTVKCSFQDRYYDFDLAVMGMDFNAAQLTPPNNNWQLKNLVNPGGAFDGPEIAFDLQPGETRTFMFKVQYNPDDSTDFIMLGIGGLLINAEFGINIDVPGIGTEHFILTRKVQPKPVMPLEANATTIPFGVPIIITGDYVLPNNMNWTSPLTLIKPGGSIRVESGRKLSFINGYTATLEGCGGLWKGIQVDNAGTAHIDKAVIMDAQFGVDMTASAGKVTVKKTVFENNEVGINITGASANSADIELSGVVFTQNAPLKVKPTVQVPAPDLFTLFGIQALNSPDIILSKDAMLGYGGKFENIRNGIAGINTKISADGSSFSNLIVQGINTGTGIQTNMGNLTVTNSSFDMAKNGIRTVNGSADISHCFISNMQFSGIQTDHAALIAHNNTMGFMKDAVQCTSGTAMLKTNTIQDITNGILTNGTVLTAENNKMTNAKTGIRANICNNMVLRKNTIRAKDFGIAFFHQALNYNAANVEENTITMEGNPDGTAIYMGGSFTIPHYEGYIFNNTLHVKQGQAGIMANVAGAAHLIYNHIDFAGNNSTAYGIRLEDGDNLTVTDNDITGSSISDATAQRGIYGMHTCRSLLSCNITDNTAYGFNFAGECSGKAPLAFQGNSMNNHSNGLLMGLPPGNGNAVIGPQVHHQNKWVGTYTGAGALHLGDLFLSTLSKFYADDQADNTYIPDVFSPIQWFIHQSNSDGLYSCAFRPGISEAAQAHEIKIANGVVQGSNDDGAIRWLAQRRLYERIMAEQNGVTGNPETDGFMETAAGNGIKAYADLRQSVQELNEVSGSDRQLLLDYDALIRQRLAELQLFQMQLADLTLTDTQKRAIKINIELAQTDLAAQVSDRENLWAFLEQQRNTQANNILANMPVLSGTERYKSNERTVNRIILEQYAAISGTLNTQQILDLEQVAVQCPVTGGEAVLWARLLLQQQKDAPVYYDDPANCIIPPTEERSGASLPALKNIRISPVPADQEVRVEYSLATDQIMVIVDAMGRICCQIPLSCLQNSTVLPVAQLPDGVYYYHIRGLASGKLILQH